MSCQARGWSFIATDHLGSNGIEATVYNTPNSKWWLYYSFNNAPYQNLFIPINTPININHSGKLLTATLSPDGTNINVSYDFQIVPNVNGPFSLDPVANGWISSEDCSNKSMSSIRASSPLKKSLSKGFLILCAALFLLLVGIAILYMFIL